MATTNTLESCSTMSTLPSQTIPTQQTSLHESSRRQEATSTERGLRELISFCHKRTCNQTAVNEGETRNQKKGAQKRVFKQQETSAIRCRYLTPTSAATIRPVAITCAVNALPSGPYQHLLRLTASTEIYNPEGIQNRQTAHTMHILICSPERQHHTA